MKQTIVYLSQLYPYPPVSGGRIKTLNTLLALAKEYSITAIFISEEIPSDKDIEFLTRRGIRVKVFYSKTILSSVKDNLRGLAWNFLRGIPHYVFQYTHKPAAAYIAHSLQKIKPDIIHIDHLNMSQYLPRVKNQRRILEHHNVETYLYWTRFIHTHKMMRKWYLCIEMILTFFYEWKMLRRFDHIFAISDPERDRLEKMFDVHNVTTQQMVYSQRPIVPISHAHPSILFIGILGWPPNEDAIEWFLRSIFPRVLEKIPDAQFHIVGKLDRRYHPTLGKNVIVHGFQKELKPFLARADVFVLPFHMGGGLRLKALTALSAGLPIVTTPLGVEGLSVEHQKECLIANSAPMFAQNIIEALRKPELRAALRNNALSYVAKKHGKNKNIEFLMQYRDAIG